MIYSTIPVPSLIKMSDSYMCDPIVSKQEESAALRVSHGRTTQFGEKQDNRPDFQTVGMARHESFLCIFDVYMVVYTSA